MNEGPRRPSVVRIAAESDGAEGLVTGDATAVAVTTPADLFDRLDSEPVDCVVVAPDGADWDPVTLLGRLAERDLAVVLVTEGDLSEYVDAGVLSAVADAVRPDGPVASAVADAVERVRDREAGGRYRALVEESPVPVGVLDAEGVIRFANAALGDLLATDPEDLVGREALSFVDGDAQGISADRLERILESGEATPAVQQTLRDGDGEAVYVLSGMQPVVFEGASAAQVVLTDITDHKRLQAELRAERDRFSTLFETLSEPVVETRFEAGRPVVVDANEAFAETFGVDAAAAAGEPLDEIIVPTDERDDDAVFSHQAEAGERLEVTVSRRTPDGDRDFLLRFVPFESGGRRGGYAIYVDITERRDWERQLRHQNERLEELASVVSHDLRNPLNVAQGTVELLRPGTNSDERELFDRIQRSHERMEAIIADALTLARRGQSVSEPEPVGLAAVAREAWGTVETPDADLDIRTEATVLADASRLRQAFENLFSNSVDHGGDGVAVRVGDLPECQPDDPRRYGGFYVEDDGQGIPESERDAVFESGYSTNDDGTGLGLGIVQSVVEAHGWEIDLAESDAGGARFEVTGVEYADR